jgi:DNA uptake protein ComE-like DNA-binding protein
MSHTSLSSRCACYPLPPGEDEGVFNEFDLLCSERTLTLTLSRRERGQDRGTILIVAMVVIFTLAAMVMVMCRSMRVETMISATNASAAQAATIERGAEQYALALLASGDDLSTLGEEYFSAVPVGTGYFWLLRPDYGDAQTSVFGLTDEIGKLNINTAPVEMLLKLPNMTEDVAAAIVDWRDSDSNLTANGAEEDHYLSLAEPYHCKNGPFETVEELLMVRGMTRDLFYGTGAAEPLGERSMFTNGGAQVFADTSTQRGLVDIVTVRSMPAPAGDATGGGTSQLINVNDANQRDRLRTLLTDEFGATRQAEIMTAIGGGNFLDIFDFYIRAELTIDEYKLIENSITTPTSQRSGRINVNTAPREVLATLPFAILPNLEPADIESLIAQRASAPVETNSMAWVLEVLDRKAIGLAQYFTGQTNQYTADILAVSGDGRAFKRCKIVIDNSGAAPQIVYRRDLTERGWPMDMSILTSLLTGQGPQASTSASTFGGSIR